MPDGTALHPWWVRYSDWWERQRRQIERRWKRGRWEELDPRLHTKHWQGSVSVRVNGERRRVTVAVVWGPGTPFFPPRVVPIHKRSTMHQLSDGDMCLLRPGDTSEGYEGVLDIDFWAERAEDWLVRYFRDGWASQVPDLFWALGAAMRPGYRYRSGLAEGLVIGLPDAWATLSPGWGHATLLVPRDGVGLGVIEEWEMGGTSYRWLEAPDLVRDPVRCRGVWVADAGGIVGGSEESIHAIGAATQALNADRWRADERRYIMLGELDTEELRWTVLGRREPEFNPMLDPMQALQRLTGIAGFAPGVVLNADSLDTRRKQGRDAAVFERIATTRFVVAGLGSLGSEIVHLLAKEGARNFVLVDGDVMRPGNEARHRAGLDAVGESKPKAVAKLVHAIVPSAQVETIVGFIDDLAPLFVESFIGPTIVIGATGDEAAEYLLSDLAEAWGTPILHAWLEQDGRLLRAMRTIPGQDPRLVDLANRLDVPKADRKPSSSAAVCAELVLPGSALDIHAAANFTVRRALALAVGDVGPDNHWLFTPSGMAESSESDPLRSPYGVVARSFGRA